MGSYLVPGWLSPQVFFFFILSQTFKPSSLAVLSPRCPWQHENLSISSSLPAPFSGAREASLESTRFLGVEWLLASGTVAVFNALPALEITALSRQALSCISNPEFRKILRNILKKKRLADPSCPCPWHCCQTPWRWWWGAWRRRWWWGAVMLMTDEMTAASLLLPVFQTPDRSPRPPISSNPIHQSPKIAAIITRPTYRWKAQVREVKK